MSIEKKNSQNFKFCKIHLEDEIVRLLNLVSELEAEKNRVDRDRILLEAHLQYYAEQLRKLQAA